MFGKSEADVRQGGLGEDERRQEQRSPASRKPPRCGQQVAQQQPSVAGAGGTCGHGVVAFAFDEHDRAHAARNDRPAEQREDRGQQRKHGGTAATPAAARRAARAPRRWRAAPARTPRRATAQRRTIRRRSRRLRRRSAPSTVRQQGRRQRDRERRARAVQKAGEDVATVAVGAEQQQRRASTRHQRSRACRREPTQSDWARRVSLESAFESADHAPGIDEWRAHAVREHMNARRRRVEQIVEPLIRADWARATARPAQRRR